MGTTSTNQGAREVYGEVSLAGDPNLATNQVSIANTATLIVAARTQRRAVIVAQHGSTNVFLGPSNVAANTGLLLTGTAGTAISIPTDGALYGITASGTQTVSYMEIY